MKIKDYLIDKFFTVICYGIATLLSAFLLWLLEVDTIFILFLEVLFLTAFFCALLWDFSRRSRYYHHILMIFDQLDEKTLLSEITDKAHFLDGKILKEILQQSNKYMNDRLNAAEHSNREYREYIEMWVHEVKNPITSAQLIIENNKNVTTLKIDDELHKIDRFVEQALFYARSTTVEKDFKLEQTSLKSLVNASVKLYSKQIIQANGHPNFVNLDYVIFADTKWCVFIIGQILANTIKYRQDNLQITFTGNVYENGVSLEISDNGIGISSTDLPRIFDKGFTGTNGRCYTKSTGIGLYLCKKLCSKMNMAISIQSKTNIGTTVTLNFPKNSLLH